MINMQLHFRKCEPSDLERLIDIAKTTFVAAFEKDNEPEDFKAYVNMAFEKENILGQLINQDSSFYFVFMDEHLVGYFKLNVDQAQTDIKTEETIELERIYVLQDFQGQRIGKLMLQKAIALAAEKNKKYIWLGVWEHNIDAIRFYQKYGFEKFAIHPYFVGKDEQTDWLLRFDLINFQSDQNN